MAFVLPTFNLSVNWFAQNNWAGSWAKGTGPVPPPDNTWSAQLRPPGKYLSPVSFLDVPSLEELVLPKGTNVLLPSAVTSEWQYWCDMMEIPAGTGRYYFVVDVFDTAKGFGNEYRTAVVAATTIFESPYFNFLPNWPYAPGWPQPYP